MNLDGFISIDRKILEWEWYLDKNTRALFFHCLLMANWKDGRFMGQDIPRGSFATSLSQLASQTNMTVKEVRTALEHLKRTGELAVKGHAQFSIITINNYCRYQDKGKRRASEGQASGTEGASSGQASGTEGATIEQSITNNNNETNYNKGTKEQEDAVGFEGECKAIGGLYNEIYLNTIKERVITEKQRELLRESLKYYDINTFKEVFQKAKASDFLQGKNGKGFKAPFEWLINIDNMQKVLDGNYDPEEPSDGVDHTPEQEFVRKALAGELKPLSFTEF